jgi:hypothetical protein
MTEAIVRVRTLVDPDALANIRFGVVHDRVEPPPPEDEWRPEALSCDQESAQELPRQIL